MVFVSDIILPVFGLVVLGFVAGRLNWMTESAIEGLSTFVFTFAIPVMLFRMMATTEIPEVIPWSYLIAYYGITLGLFFSTLLSGRTIGLNVTQASIFAMTASYSNVVLLGIPLVIASLGDAATVPLFMIVSLHPATMFLLTTLFAEIGTGETGKLSQLPLQTLKVLTKNMIVVGMVIGLIVNLADVDLPSGIDRMATYLGSAALPCAVFSIGASISRYKISGDYLKIAIILAAKNLIHPLLVWFVCAWLFEFEPVWTAVAVILAACPAGINAYVFASRYQAIVPSTATAIVLSTLVAIPVLSVVLALL
jgi:malonate transporter and related proteins